MTENFEVLTPTSRRIWEQKYRFGPEKTIEDTWRRVAKAAAQAEKKADTKRWTAKFYDIMSDFAFLPGGRILAGAGTDRNVTLFNCFVMGKIQDDMTSIFDNVRESALTMQRGGGIGHDFSTLRPQGAPVRGVGAEASGPVSFMDVWDAMCRTIMSAGARRGAMMATMRCDHPDIEAFIDAKRDPLRLRNFNVSVLVTDAFMQAVAADAPWSLSFEGQVYSQIPARVLWDKIMSAAYQYAEPGVIFIDRVNGDNNLKYCETINATNPCGEQPLPPYGACLLGSINLTRLVKRPFERNAILDLARLDDVVATAVRFLDCIIDISRFPLEAQAQEARDKRRMGLGVTGLADALILSGRHYGSQDARDLASGWMARIERQAYLTSAALAAEKGSFPLFEADAYLAGGHASRLDADVRSSISANGLRNGLLTSIAPTGTISLLAGNVSSGVEPVFDFIHRRRILETDGSAREEVVEDYAYRLFRLKHGASAGLPDYFTTAQHLIPADHVNMQAALQRHVDSSISKTVNCPAAMPFNAFKDVYAQAYAKGLKGCTAYRPNATTGAVLTPLEVEPAAPVTLDEGSSGTAHPSQNRTAAISAPGAGSAIVRDIEATDGAPLQRAAALTGVTYKLKWPESDHAIYVTINDIIHNGRRRPFEIFINSKNLEHHAWTVALTRMISAVFRRGGDVSFVVEELKAVFDPRGGYWLDGRYVPSLLAAIGGVVEQHMTDIGFIAASASTSSPPGRNSSKSGKQGVSASHPIEPFPKSVARFSDEAPSHYKSTAGSPDLTGVINSGPGLAGKQTLKTCPRCGHPAFAYIEGCHVCQNCGYSKCD